MKEIWLTNPPRKRARKRTAAKKSTRRTKRKPPNGFKTWSAYMASIRPGAKKSTTKKRRRRAASTNTGRATVARKRKRSTAKRSTTKRRRTYRRNPGGSKALTKRISAAAVGAGMATGGKMAVNSLANLLPASVSPVMQLVAKVVAAIGVGVVADKVVGRAHADLVMIGALQAPLESAITQYAPPALSSGLNAYPQLQSYTSRRQLAGYTGGSTQQLSPLN